jgi:hypothetical protein
MGEFPRAQPRDFRMAKKAMPTTYRWRITLIKGTPAKYLGDVEATDEKAAIGDRNVAQRGSVGLKASRSKSLAACLVLRPPLPFPALLAVAKNQGSVECRGHRSSRKRHILRKRCSECPCHRTYAE